MFGVKKAPSWGLGRHSDCMHAFLTLLFRPVRVPPALKSQPAAPEVISTTMSTGALRWGKVSQLAGPRFLSAGGGQGQVMCRTACGP